ncbi:MAG: hypothetical protein LBU92_02175 [Prevotellaceae bacterium]|jgi:hypothetical protein|nr:hypothetical protein [Prevotellaceae bacterium]
MKNACLFLALLLALCACQKDGGSDAGESASPDGSGQGGSMARFAVVGNYLYTVDEYKLQAFDISNAAAPVRVSSAYVGFDIETIFPNDGYLFIGSRNGMYIYDVNAANSAQPEALSMVPHAYSCDPVAVNDKYAFVTLNNGNVSCQRNVNELQIISIANKSRPEFIKSYPMEGPQGVGVDDTTLFVCDKDFLKVYNAANVNNIELRHKFPFPDAYDVIPSGNLLVAMGSHGLRQYRYTADTIIQLSQIDVE